MIRKALCPWRWLSSEPAQKLFVVSGCPHLNEFDDGSPHTRITDLGKCFSKGKGVRLGDQRAWRTLVLRCVWIGRGWVARGAGR